MRGWLLSLVASLALVACSEQAVETEPSPAPTPLLLEISDQGGTVRGWMFGTIHSLPDGTRWRTGTLEDVTDKADLLLVEVADLGDTTALARTFTRLGTSPAQGSLGARVPAPERAGLEALIQRSRFSDDDFAQIETWAAALMLAQASSSGDSANGADRALLAAFAGREIREFEGAQMQLSIFDQLPRSEQVDLLLGVVEETELKESDPERLQRAWITGDEQALIDATTSGILADPELRTALLVERNQAWSEELVRILNEGDVPLVAVGAAHLVGPDGLPAMLRDRGFTVVRIQ